MRAVLIGVIATCSAASTNVAQLISFVASIVGRMLDSHRSLYSKVIRKMNRPTLFLALTALAVSLAAAELPNERETNRERLLATSISRMVANGGGSLLRADFDSATLPAQVVTWLNANKRALVDAHPNPFAEALPWGTVTWKHHTLYLHIMKWPENGKLTVPRLHNSVKSVRFTTRAGELALIPDVKDWKINLPEEPQPESLLPIVAIELNAAPAVARDVAPIVKQAEQGIIVLHARDAIVHGKMLRFEPQPHKDTIGYWVEQDDWAEWSCEASTSGTYAVELRYGCGEGQGGSEVEITVGVETLPFQVEATGGFQAWRNVVLGNLELKAGEPVRVTVKPKRKARNAVMDIQQIVLRIVP